MRLSISVLAAAFCGFSAVVAAQTLPSTGATAARPMQPPTPAMTPPAPSSILQPSLDLVKQAVATVRLERWKGPGALRDEADKNLGSIQRDIEATLPPLLAAADASPRSVAAVLPAYRNVEALYDVLLRVATTGHIEAPADQNSALDQALSSLDASRRSLAESLQANAVAQEKRTGDLQAALKTAQAAPVAAAAAPPCTPAPTTKKKKPAAKS